MSQRNRAGGIWIAMALCLLACAATHAEGGAAVEEPAEPAKAPAVKEIKMFAENWKWTPNTIRVPQGTLLKIRIENIEAPHRFKMKGYKLNVPLPEGETTTIEIQADKAGTFRWYCSRPCGNGCPKMTGKLIVQETDAG